MKSITAAQLQKDTKLALRKVEAGESYVVTKQNKPIARLVPLGGNLEIISPRNPGRVRLSQIPGWPRKTREEIEALLVEMEEDT